MEDCYICYKKTHESEFKVLSCQHKLCKSCYLHLSTNFCPFCRQTFTYSRVDIYNRQELNLNYINNNNTSPQLFDINTLSNDYNFNFEFNIPNARIRRNKNRKRRKNLTMEEIQEKRRLVRKKCKKKWNTKEGRLSKLKWYELD